MRTMLYAIVAGLCLATASHTAHGESREADIVVLVSVDGLAAFYFDDPYADLPNIRQLAAQGARAKGMLPSFPSSTWPTHVSMATGVHPARHGVISNRTLNRETNQTITYIGDRELTGPEAIQVPPLYEIAHEAGMTTGGVNWPAGHGFDSIRWLIPDSNSPDIHAEHTVPEGFLDELVSAGVERAPELAEWRWAGDRAEDRDEVYKDIAVHLIREHQPDLLLVHFITPDHRQHGSGPESPEAYEAIHNADRRIGEIWHALQQTDADAALFVSADHGFARYDRHVRVNSLLREMGLIEVDDDNNVVSRQAWMQGNAIHIFDEDNRDEIAERIREEVGGLVAVDSVLGPDEFMPLGLPHPDDNPEQGHLMVSFNPGYSGHGSVEGPVIAELDRVRGAHGHRPDRRYMHAMLIGAGAGIEPGVEIDLASVVDIAPTMARLLGLEIDTDGRVLEEWLTD